MRFPIGNTSLLRVSRVATPGLHCRAFDHLNGFDCMTNEPVSQRTVVVTVPHFDTETIRFLESHSLDVVVPELPPGKPDSDLTNLQLRALLERADGWIVGHASIDRELLEGLPRLKVIARRGVGHERVNVKDVEALGKVATIAVGGNDASVADHALAMMLALLHRLRESQAEMERGIWRILVGGELYGKTIGLVGLGRTARAVVQRLRGFEPRIIATSRSWDDAFCAGNGIERVELPELLSRSDIVSLHLPLVPATRNLVSAAEFEWMKRSAILINTARGGVVDDRALLDALRSGEIAGAGLDVFASETDEGLRPTTEALLALPNVIATPHAAGSSQEGLMRTNRIAAQNVVAVLEGRSPASEHVIADGRAIASSA